KEKTDGKGKIWHWGVRLYTSKDFYNWEDRGLIIPPTPNDLKNPLHPTYCVDRPHILYCKKTRKYVAWLKVMADDVSQFMTIMTADNFEGPYEMVHKVYKPLNMDSGDFCLHADEDGKAYIWFERPHFQMICATLSEDYTEVTEEYSVHYDGLIPPYTREAPTYFEHGGYRYLITSGTTGYFPNESKVCRFKDPHGDYEDLGNPFVGDKHQNSFSSQVTSVIQIPETGQYVACADRWKPQWYTNFLSKQIVSGMERHFADYKLDLSPKEVHDLPGVETPRKENTSISRYVWLPMDWEEDKPVIRWKKEWMI
ncbi:MAG: family 43 glycosylhydrolase, partial [Lachnospiraceae bacterium]|nr:family 43 glycosylhydrolase [Lachnospiraceae bacterium]